MLTPQHRRIVIDHYGHAIIVQRKGSDLHIARCFAVEQRFLYFEKIADRILFFGTGGAYKNVVFGPFPPFLMNGMAQPEPMNLKIGTKYRFRLFNLAGDVPLMVTVKNGQKPFEWRAVAKDGYPLPPSQATMRPATLVFDPGEIYDYELTPRAAGELTLQFGVPPFVAPPPPPPGAPPPPVPPPTITVPIRIR